MRIQLNPESSRFPAITWVDASKQGDNVNLIFGTRIEDQATPLRFTITSGQWQNLKFLVDGLKLVGS